MRVRHQSTLLGNKAHEADPPVETITETDGEERCVRSWGMGDMRLRKTWKENMEASPWDPKQRIKHVSETYGP